MKYHLTLCSSNRKVGNIPVSTSPIKTCPRACPFKNKGCYADGGPLKIHWDKVSRGERGKEWKTFLQEIRSLPSGQVWRHNQAGDLRGSKNLIAPKALEELVHANQGKIGFTYTHYPVEGETSTAIMNRYYVAWACLSGFTINLSADNLEQADRMVALNIAPVTVTLPANTPLKPLKTPGGRTVIICPAVLKDDMTCAQCKMCAKLNRKVIIGFPCHGIRKKQMSEYLQASCNSSSSSRQQK